MTLIGSIIGRQLDGDLPFFVNVVNTMKELRLRFTAQEKFAILKEIGLVGEGIL
jgi:hypothetical protein